MGSFFTLELDTTAPYIEINMPSYSDPYANNPIRVSSNEKIGSMNEIYLIDSNGNRFDLILNKSNKELYGNVILNKLSIGIATLYAQLDDEVGNKSNLASKSINIISQEDNLRMSVDVKSVSMKTTIMNDMMETDTDLKTMNLANFEKSLEQVVNAKESSVSISHKLI